MTALFDARDSGNRARRNIAPGPPATAGESLLSVYMENVTQGFLASENLILHRQYGLYLEEIEAQTGQSFANPFDRN